MKGARTEPPSSFPGTARAPLVARSTRYLAKRRSVGLMRTVIGLLAVAMVLAACGGDSAPTSTSATPSSTQVTASSSSDAPTTSTTAAPPTTTEAPDLIDAELLVAGPDAVSLVHTDLTVETLVDSPAFFAIDDLEGGVLFQIERWSDNRRSIVYQVAQGGSEAVATLIPAIDQGLTLNGMARDDGDPYIYYTRREGETPDDAVHTLRRYNLTSREVSELTDVGGWEWGSFPISISNSLILTNWSAEASHGMDFFDLEGNVAAVAADPDPVDDAFFDCYWECPSVGELSQDSERLVYVEEVDGDSYAVIRHVASGAEIRRLNLGFPDAWWVAAFDLNSNYLVVNRETTDSMLQAWVFDLRDVDPEITVLPTAGYAYLTRSPVDISGPVPGP